MLWFLLGVIVVLFAYLYRPHEHFSLFGHEIINIHPIVGDDTCKPNESREDGMCYAKCKPNFHGAATMCVADSHNRGIGTVVGLEDCPAGWFTEGLTCREPITGGGCNTHCDGNWNSNDGGFCHTRCEPLVGGRVKGRLDGGGKCPGPQGGDKPDRTDGMCYSSCPKDKPKPMPGFPYLCYAGGPLTYDRGVGKIPYVFRVAGKYGFLGRLID